MDTTPPVLEKGGGMRSSGPSSPVPSSPSSMKSASVHTMLVPPAHGSEPSLGTLFTPFVTPFLAGAGFCPPVSQMPSAIDYFYLASLFGAGVPPIGAMTTSNACPADSFPDLLQRLARQRPLTTDADKCIRHSDGVQRRSRTPRTLPSRSKEISKGRDEASDYPPKPVKERSQSRQEDEDDDDESAETMPIDFSKKRPQSESLAASCPKRPCVSTAQDNVETDGPQSSSSVTRGEVVSNNHSNSSSEEGVPMKSTADMQLDQNLLNASAVAWAALSNQLLLSSLQGSMFMGTPGSMSLPGATFGCSSDIMQSRRCRGTYHRGSSNGNSSGRRRGSRGRPATISLDESGKQDKRSSVDDTIDNVVSGQRDTSLTSNLMMTLPAQYQHLLQMQQQQPTMADEGMIRNKTRRGVSRRSGRGSRGGYTVREQLALKRAGAGSFLEATSLHQDSNGHVQKDKEEEEEEDAALDLSATSRLDQGSLSSPHHHHGDASLPASQAEASRKPMVNMDLLRIPLSYGWRRQTIIRHISSSGVRGDVLYYAPCGKRLTSYAEVIRYLRKHSVENLSRVNFSLSSKILIGEFLYNRNDGVRNGLMKLSDAEVSNVVKQLSRLANCQDESTTSEEVNGDVTDNRSRNAKSTSLKRRGVDARVLLRQKVVTQLKGGEKVDSSTDQVWLKRQQIGQDLRKVVELVKRQRDEQRKLDLQSKLARFRQMRMPVEDMELEQTKHLPELRRVENLQLDGAAFADLLLVVHFLSIFGEVLKIDKDEIPSLSAMHAGLLNDPAHRQCVVSLTKVLLTLVLEYPGLPPGSHSRTCTGQPRRELKVTSNNYSELLRMFLSTRKDKNGPEMAAFLERSSFESLKPNVKCRILAYMCDELLYCRNVVREIENSIDVLAKLKSDKWAIKGKIRALHTLQVQKENAEKGESTEKLDADEKTANNYAQTKSEREPCFEHELSAEEKALSPDQIKTKIESCSKDVDDMRFTISDSSYKIRCLPLGQDRFQRYYWMLPQYSGVLVESVESSCRSNQALNRKYLKPELKWQDGTAASFHVRDCVDALLDGVCSMVGDQDTCNLSLTEQTLVSSSSDQYQSGWWIMDTPDLHESLSQSLNQKGIRERLFSRSLAKHSEFFKDDTLRKEKKALSLSHVNAKAPPSFKSELLAVLKAVLALEEKCFQANIHVNGWCPEDWKTCQKRVFKTDSELWNFIKERLLTLQCNVEHRYFLPFSNNNHVKLVSSSPSGEPAKLSAIAVVESSDPDFIPSQLTSWRNGVQSAQTAAQFFMCVDALESFIAWEKSIMKASCQICRDDSNESQLLLCDGCDMGYHTYCFKPKMEKVPDEDWYCPECVAKATRRPCCLICCRHSSLPMATCAECKREFHFDCIGLESGKKSKQGWLCQGCNKLKSGAKKGSAKRRKCNTVDKVQQEEVKKKRKQPAEKKQPSGDKKKADGKVTYSQLDYEEICGILLAELDAHKDSWPFKVPVDTKVIPLYKRVIKRPMDLSTIHSKLIGHAYQKSDDFIKDVNLIFDNCQTFNEDESKIGKAGHCLRRFFNRRWKELTDAIKSRSRSRQ